ncbi:hypothetical protein ACLB2K_038759 [Fragaria x ananassa]
MLRRKYISERLPVEFCYVLKGLASLRDSLVVTSFGVDCSRFFCSDIIFIYMKANLCTAEILKSLFPKHPVARSSQGQGTPLEPFSIGIERTSQSIFIPLWEIVKGFQTNKGKRTLALEKIIWLFAAAWSGVGKEEHKLSRQVLRMLDELVQFYATLDGSEQELGNNMATVEKLATETRCIGTPCIRKASAFELEKVKMEASHKKKGKRPNLLADTVFSWSLDDVLNERLFKNKVEKIPESFNSVEHYFGCYLYPLLEETRAQVHSSMETIHRAPYAKVVSFENAKPYGRKLYNIKVDYWRNRSNDRGKDPYKTLPGDLFVLANAKPQTVSDLQRVGRSWAFGSVTKVSENDDTASLYFKVKASKELEVLKSTTPLVMVFLVNLIPNGRIWKALHMSKNLKIIKEVLCPDSVAQKSLCSEKNNDIVNMGLVQRLSSGLNESQTGTVLACLEMLHSHDKSAVELIWGPPGTGKTKTIVTLLLSLLQMNCRTLVCAPTNFAITEIASRLVKMVTEVESNALYCSLGKVLLFGNKERLKVGSDVEEVYLDYRLKRLVECLGPQTGWRHCFTSMIECLEDGVSHYHTFLKKGITIEKEPETTGQMKVKESRIVTKVGEDKCKTFLEFIRDRFVSAASPLRYCISIFCTHMVKNHISVDIFQNMGSLVNLVDSLESLLFQCNVAPEALEDIFSHSEVEDISETCVDNSFLLYTNRRECLKVLHKLFDSLRKLDLPDFMKQESLMAYCFQSASLIFCTASSSYKLHKLAMEPLSVVVVDEAAQLKECESTIPLQLPGVRHAVLVGDECQLPAIVKSIVSDEAGFARSLFERLSVVGHSKHLLNMQYRMHPSISSFPNSSFYNNMILDAPYIKRRGQEKYYLKGSMFGPYSCINVIGGREQQDEDGRSRKNMVEVAVVSQILRNLYKEWIDSKQNLSIGVVSPYAAQVVAIEDPEYLSLHESNTEAELTKYFMGSCHGTTVIWIRRSRTELLVGVDSLMSQTYTAINPNHKRQNYELLLSFKEVKFIEIVPNVYATLCGDAIRCQKMKDYVNEQMKEHNKKSQMSFTVAQVGRAAIEYFHESPLDPAKDHISLVHLCSWIPDKQAHDVRLVGDGLDRAIKVNDNVFGSGSGSFPGLSQLIMPEAARDMDALIKELMEASENDPYTGGVIRVYSIKCGESKLKFEGSVLNELYHHKTEYENKFYDGKTMIFIIQNTDERILSPLDLELHLHSFDTGVRRKSILWLCSPTGFLVYLVKLSSPDCCKNWFGSCNVFGNHIRQQTYTNEDSEICDYYLAYASREVFDRAVRMTSFKDLVKED